MSKSEQQRTKYWQSLNVLSNDPKFKEAKKHEFQDGVTDEFDYKKMDKPSRRKFLAIMGASTAFAATACDNYRDKGEIITYNKKPEEVTYGKANFYASSYNIFPYHCSVLIKTREGRPIKVEGNPEQPIDNGKINSQAQAGILDLYDPSRLKHPLKKSGDGLLESNWELLDEANGKLDAAAGKEIAIVTHTVLSPTQKKLFEDFAVKYPSAKVYSYELFDNRNSITAWRKCYGTDATPVWQWDKAKIILALESDFLGVEGHTTEQIAKYSKTRDVENLDGFSRLYSVEAAMSLTGSNADYRMRLTPEHQLDFVLALLGEVIKGKSDVPAEVVNAVGNASLSAFTKSNGMDQKKIASLLKDLKANQGKTIISVGESLPEEVHIAVNYLNEVLGNTALIDTDQRNQVLIPYATMEEWKELAKNMSQGKVGAVIHFDTNPIYHLPQDLGYDLSKVGTVISLTETHNETTQKSHYVFPISHAFESWGDMKFRSGIINTQQPVIAPLYKTKQKEAILLAWIEGGSKADEANYHKYMQKNWQENIYTMINPVADFKKFWFSVLHDGFVTFKEPLEAYPQIDVAPTFLLNNSKKKSGITLLLKKSPALGDGRYANNGWLQELPHPVSKACWDNYASISPAMGKKLGVKNNDMIEVAFAQKSLKLPVMLQPGMAEETIAVDMGYGRTNSGAIGNDVGFNANIFLSAVFGISSMIYTGIRATKTEGTYDVFSTQEHHSLDDEFVKDLHKSRKIIQEGTVEEYKKHPHFLHEGAHDLDSITPDIEYPDKKWAMAIDLNKCIGCNQCTTSCNVENNIPVVGKTEVGHGREMHWIRLDRYYSGTAEEPEISHQPLLCQHCDNAPCENVCPVVATSHSPDGLNQMTYNRCVGTRYCANNCPYKVRRFNFYDFRDNLEDGYYDKDTLKLLHNPEVTVRSRGVMEKCTFCVQRISEAKQDATTAGKELDGSSIKTACQEACPAEAVVFGDMNDPNSKISQLRKHNLGYHVLEILNVKPNVTYIAKLRNKHSEEA
jgi:MoCo/4Fe-4S cofactor protein with predicted Tat translocation signal